MSFDPAVPKLTGVVLDAAATPQSPSVLSKPSNSPAVIAAPADSPVVGVDSAASKRRQLLMRLLASVLLFGAVFFAHRAWTWYAEYKFSKFVTGLQEAGEPVWSKDFARPPVADADNAAFEIREAAEALQFDYEGWQGFFGGQPVGIPLTEQEITFVQHAVKANQTAMAHLSAAVRKPGVDWSSVKPVTNPSAPASFGPRGPGMYQQRTLGYLLFASALTSHQMNDDVAALARVNELLFLARTYAKRPTLRSQGAALRVYDIALSALNEILPDLAIGDGDGQIPAKQVRALIAELLDESEPRRALLNSFRTERARHFDFLLTGGDDDFSEPTPSKPLSWNDPLPIPWPGSGIERFLTRPVYLGHAERAMERFGWAISAIEARTWREFDAAIPEVPALRVDTNGEPISEGMASYARYVDASIRHAGDVFYSGEARRRTSALALAVILYQSEHGEWPGENLQELVPNYLERVPEDPVSPLGDPLLFVSDEERPRVYSVGDDGIDDGGWPAYSLSLRQDDRRTADWVIDLIRQPRDSNTSFRQRR